MHAAKGDGNAGWDGLWWGLSLLIPLFVNPREAALALSTYRKFGGAYKIPHSFIHPSIHIHTARAPQGRTDKSAATRRLSKALCVQACYGSSPQQPKADAAT